MRFLVPKPLHGWRAFVGEVGIIVIGVLIALAAQQAVESFNANRQLEDTSARLALEVKRNLTVAHERLIINQCQKDRLVELRDQLMAPGPQWKGTTAKLASGVYDDVLAPVYRGPSRTWSQDAWRTAMSSGVLNNGSADRAEKIGKLYTIVAAMEAIQNAESNDSALLGDLAFDGPLSAADRRADLKILSRLNSANAKMVFFANELTTLAAASGFVLSAKDKQPFLKFQKAFRGACVVDVATPPK